MGVHCKYQIKNKGRKMNEQIKINGITVERNDNGKTYEYTMTNYDLTATAMGGIYIENN